jgi:hypothetical protein
MKSATPSGNPAECAGCRSREHILHYPERGERLCPNCASLYDRYDAATESMRELLNAVIPSWLDHWQERGLSLQEGGEILGLEAGAMAAEYVRLAKKESDDA